MHSSFLKKEISFCRLSNNLCLYAQLWSQRCSRTSWRCCSATSLTASRAKNRYGDKTHRSICNLFSGFHRSKLGNFVANKIVQLTDKPLSLSRTIYITHTWPSSMEDRSVGENIADCCICLCVFEYWLGSPRPSSTLRGCRTAKRTHGLWSVNYIFRFRYANRCIQPGADAGYISPLRSVQNTLYPSLMTGPVL